jgi:hypothetical protein
MAVDKKIQYIDPAELYLDPRNPRLGRRNTAEDLSQAQVLELMEDWTLDELAISFIESGFWPQEALLVTEEKVAGVKRLVVIEGNRRLAALRFLALAQSGKGASKRWTEIVKSAPAKKLESLNEVPYLRADSREDVESYLGFRHVTGIKPWKPAEKAEYIAHLIEKRGMSYQQVMRKIGSKTPTVRQHYIAFRLLLQMESADDSVALDKVEGKFSVLYLSLRVPGVKAFLSLDLDAEPKKAKRPVPPSKDSQLVKFALWLFGDEKRPPLVSDSRLIDRFGKILLSADALDYLERTEDPNFDTAYRKTGEDAEDVIGLLQKADDYTQEALTSAHRFRGDEKVLRVARRFAADAVQLIRVFPEIDAELFGKSDAPAS